MELYRLLKKNYGEVFSLISDDGRGSRISEWSGIESQPTTAEIRDITG